MKRLFRLVLAVGVLTGCAGVPPLAPVSDPEAAWARHEARLQNVNDWHLTGRLALRTENEGWHASLDWQQQDDGYLMRLRAPLGSGSLQLQGDAGWVVLRTSNGEEAVSTDPEGLLLQQLGWQVPVSNLRYWVRGLPAPGAASRKLDEHGHLARLWQNGWEIEFLDYGQVGAVYLPGRVFARFGDAEVRLVVGNWDLSAAPGEEAAA